MLDSVEGAEDGIRDRSPSRGLGDVYKRQVFVKPINASCTQRWNNGVVTGVGSGVQIKVDGIPRHIADIRAVPKEEFKETDDDRLLDSVEGAEDEEVGDVEENAEDLEDVEVKIEEPENARTEVEEQIMPSAVIYGEGSKIPQIA